MFNYHEIEQETLEYIPVAEKSELGNGDVLFLEIGDHEIVLFNVAGEFFAIGDVCSHDGEDLGDGEIDGHEVICPRHGARFDIRTGEATALPAVVDIPAYPVRITSGKVEIGVPKEVEEG
jgi:3-phenylpropionate/trans-cinnamate dioxygenase ferredoxin subunit